MLGAAPSTPQYRDAAAVGRVQQAPGGDNSSSETDYSPQWLLSALPRPVPPCKMKRTLNLSHLCVFQMDQSAVCNLSY